MTTKKQAREIAKEKHDAFMEQQRQIGLKALERARTHKEQQAAANDGPTAAEVRAARKAERNQKAKDGAFANRTGEPAEAYYAPEEQILLAKLDAESPQETLDREIQEIHAAIAHAQLRAGDKYNSKEN